MMQKLRPVLRVPFLSDWTFPTGLTVFNCPEIDTRTPVDFFLFIQVHNTAIAEVPTRPNKSQRDTSSCRSFPARAVKLYYSSLETGVLRLIQPQPQGIRAPAFSRHSKMFLIAKTLFANPDVPQLYSDHSLPLPICSDPAANNTDLMQGAFTNLVKSSMGHKDEQWRRKTLHLS